MSELRFQKHPVIAAILWCCLAATAAYGQSADQSSQYPQDQPNPTDQQSSQTQQNSQSQQNASSRQNQQNSNSRSAESAAESQNPSGDIGRQSSTGQNRSNCHWKPVRNATNVAIRNFLQNRPEVMEQLKLLLVQRLRAEGSLVDEQTVSDQAVYDRMQNDPGVPRRSCPLADSAGIHF